MPEPVPRPLLTPLRISIALHALLLGVLVYLVPEPEAPRPETPMTFRMVGEEDPLPEDDGPSAPTYPSEPIDDLELPDFDVLLPPLAIEEEMLPDEPEEAGVRPPPAAIHVPRDGTRKPRPEAPEVRPAPPSAAPSRPAPAVRRMPRVVRRPGTLRGFYPREAQQQGVEGTVYVLVLVDERGQVVSTRVQRSSGHASLDRAALRVARFYEFAPGAPGRALLPVPFRLRD